MQRGQQLSRMAIQPWGVALDFRSEVRVYGAQSLRLTPAGQQVLGQQADRVRLLGVDRWVGGTHVTADRTWRWDPEARLFTEPA